VEINTDARNRRSLGLSDVHTGHAHPITGTPWLVPLPKNSSETEGIRPNVRYL
jgi:hypothetical protein